MKRKTLYQLEDSDVTWDYNEPEGVKGEEDYISADIRVMYDAEDDIDYDHLRARLDLLITEKQSPVYYDKGYGYSQLWIFFDVPEDCSDYNDLGIKCRDKVFKVIKQYIYDRNSRSVFKSQ